MKMFRFNVLKLNPVPMYLHHVDSKITLGPKFVVIIRNTLQHDYFVSLMYLSCLELELTVVLERVEHQRLVYGHAFCVPIHDYQSLA